jgi:hypothetical protein
VSLSDGGDQDLRPGSKKAIAGVKGQANYEQIGILTLLVSADGCVYHYLLFQEENRQLLLAKLRGILAILVAGVTSHTAAPFKMTFYLVENPKNHFL